MRTINPRHHKFPFFSTIHRHYSRLLFTAFVFGFLLHFSSLPHLFSPYFLHQISSTHPPLHLYTLFPSILWHLLTISWVSSITSSSRRLGARGGKEETKEHKERACNHLVTAKTSWPTFLSISSPYFTLFLSLSWIDLKLWCYLWCIVSSLLDWGLGLCALAHDDVVMNTLLYA